MEITRETVIGDIVDFDPETAEVFMDCGMHCIDSPYREWSQLKRLARFTALTRMSLSKTSRTTSSIKTTISNQIR